MRKHHVRSHYRKLRTNSGGTRLVRVRGYTRGSPGIVATLIGLLALANLVVNENKEKAPSPDANVQTVQAAQENTSAVPIAKYWNHNGSVVSLDLEGNRARFSYATPRPGLSVRIGEALFYGHVNGSAITGQAFLFFEGCPHRIGYTVGGIISADGAIIKMRGKKPIGNGCMIVGLSEDELVFRKL